MRHSARVAQERVFVEHAVKAIRQFHWLDRRGPLTPTDLQLLDPILSIIRGLVNLGATRPCVKKEVSAIWLERPCAHEIMYGHPLLDFAHLKKMEESAAARQSFRDAQIQVGLKS